MRQKAEKLEKGKWYADSCPDEKFITFLKFHHSYSKIDCYSEQKKVMKYVFGKNGLIRFISGANDRFVPTQEDREKYNLIDDE